MWLDVPAQAVNGLLFILKLRPKQAFKQRMFGFLRLIDVERAVEDFWAVNMSRVKPFYRELHRADDVVISASPEFLIRPACTALGIEHVLASPVDPHTGCFSGLNCHGEEKVRRFRAIWPDATVENFYSDSHSDDPMAAMARRAWLVRGEVLRPWDG